MTQKIPKGEQSNPHDSAKNPGKNELPMPPDDPARKPPVKEPPKERPPKRA